MHTPSLPSPLDPSSTAQRGEAAPRAAPATTATGSSVVTLDATALAGLRELDPQGRNGLIERVVKAFQESLARLSPQLLRAIAASDTQGIRHVAHTLKSSSASIGALRLSQLCAELEAAARSGATQGLRARTDAVCVEIESVKPALEKLALESR